MDGFVKKLIIFVSLFFLPSFSSAGEIYTASINGIERIVLEGRINKGDYEKVYNFAKAVGPVKFNMVYLRSNGGNFRESKEIGELFRKLKVGVSAPRSTPDGPVCSDEAPPKDNVNCTCLSACAFIYLGAAERYGTYIGVHRPYFKSLDFSKLSPGEAEREYISLKYETSNYLNGMGVNSELYETIMSAASDEMTMLDKDYIKKHLSGWIPVYDEWMKAKCSADSLGYNRSHLKKIGLKMSIDTASNKEMDIILGAFDKISNCTRKARRELRVKGFKDVYWTF